MNSSSEEQETTNTAINLPHNQLYTHCVPTHTGLMCTAHNVMWSLSQTQTNTRTSPPHPSALCPQVKLRLWPQVVQPLRDVHQWTGAVVHLVWHIGLGLMTLTISPTNTIWSEWRREEVVGYIAVISLATSHTHCPTITSTLLTLTSPHSTPSFPHLTPPLPTCPSGTLSNSKLLSPVWVALEIMAAVRGRTPLELTSTFRNECGNRSNVYLLPTYHC